VRASCLVLLLTLGTVLTAGERPVAGPETLLGDDALAPLTTWSFRSPALATDGDELLFVWSGRGSIYAQRLDRQGKPLTPLPTLLFPGRQSNGGGVTNMYAVWAGGFYHIFFSVEEDWSWSLRVMRVTRDAELVDVRVLAPGASASDVAVVNDEIIVAGYRTLWRLRPDLSVIATEVLERSAPHTIARAADGGLLLLAGGPPAVTARRLDRDGGTVRIGTATSSDPLRILWTGTEYLAAWSSCEWGGCGTTLLRLDARLVPKGDPKVIGGGNCYSCDIGLTSLGDETVLVTWQATTANGSHATHAKRVRAGVVLDEKDLVFGPQAATVRTPQGLLVLADSTPQVHVISPAFTAERTAAPRAAAEETVAAVASSPSGFAVVRRRAAGAEMQNIATILDDEGNVRREVRLPPGSNVALASFGRDFYALVTDSWSPASWFQKVEEGAPAVRLPQQVLPLLVWTGRDFLTLQAGWYEEGEYQAKTRVLWLDRNGAPKDVPCGDVVLPGASWDVRVFSGGGETFVVTPQAMLRLRGRCPRAEPAPPLPEQARVAWQAGVWAALVPGGANFTFDIGFASDVPSLPGARRRIFAGRDYVYGKSIAPLDGNWLVALNTAGRGISLLVVDGHGGVIGTGTLAKNVTDAPVFAPLAGGRLLAVYARQVYEPPYLGVSRVVVAPVTTEEALRRQGVRR
jgi:hypothetical protein